ncbi:DUF6531 domain-containing protein [Streptomyces xiamenensis]|uniref:DUF6531 domain-containing protein n=1 Tax=Streptomyces xiamenensis TaxID=408015 RepID=UPI0036C4C8B0
MGRASDWSPVGMTSDPTPGDPDRVEELADKLLAFADDVADAQDKLRNLMGDSLLDTFTGETADAFGEQMEKVPPNLAKLHESHELAGQALATYWPKLRQAQADADRALDDAVEAQSDLASAETWLETAASSLETAQEEAEPPDEGEVRAEVRRALTDAEGDHEDAQSAVTGAQGRLDAAKLLAQQAKEARQEAASLCVSDLRTASDAGIKNKKWWEKVVDWVADNWDTIVQVAQIIGTIVGIAALFIGGPLIAGILLAVALVALADTLVAYSKGEASLWDVGFAVLDVLPGGRLVGAGARTARTGLRDTATTVRGERPQIRQDGRRMDSRNECGDPVDVATGELVMSATDITLPGVLPLVLERHHISTYRSGRWFGRSWASTLDQRLRLDDYGVRFYSADGMILNYPIPLADPDHPVLPTEGPRWGLLWDGNPQTGMRVHQRETGRTLHFAPHPTRPGPDLRLSAITDRNSNRITVHYDEHGVPAELEHTGGYRIHIATYEGRITALHLASDPERPLLMSYGYDADGNLSEIYNSSGLPLRFSYDDRARLTRWEDRNHTWYRYEYDAEGRVVFSTGTERALEYRYAYEPEHHRTTATNSLGHDTLYQFNDSLQLIAETDPLGNTTHRTWDRYDRPLSVMDPLGNTTRYTYDEAGNLKAVTRPDGSEITARHNDLGLLLRVEEPDGAVWSQEFDDAGNRITGVDPLGMTSLYEYDDHGALTGFTDPEGGRTEFSVTDTGLPQEVRNPLGEVTRYHYDPFGRTIRITEPSGAVMHAHWSPNGKLLSFRDSMGAEQSWEWDPEGNCIAHISATGTVTQFKYGTFDLPSSITHPNGAIYEFTRDTELNLIGVKDPDGRVWEYTYDAVGRLIKESDYDDRSTGYEWDEAGRAIGHVNQVGQSVEYSYNSLGQITRKSDSDGSSTSYAYDAMGRLLNAASEGIGLARTYDRLGRLQSETINGRTLSLGYTSLGQLKSRKTPSGHLSTWAYNASGDRTDLHTGNHSIAFNRDAMGNEVQRIVDDSLVVHQDWDLAGRLVGQTVTGPDKAGHRAPVQRQYKYRADGYLTSITTPTGSTEFSLDANGRVTSLARPQWNEDYSYDLSGNLVEARFSEGEYPALGRRAYEGTLVKKAGRFRYRYDAAGRTVFRQEVRLSRQPDNWHYIWGPENQLLSTTTPDGTRWRYVYDPLGRRIAKQRLGDGDVIVEQIHFTWHGTTLVEESSNLLGTMTWDYNGLHPLTQVHQHEGEHSFYTVMTDLVGTPTDLLDEHGEKVWTSRSTLWGASKERGHGEFPGLRMPLRFPGQYFDQETGWHYNLHRHYDPSLARYSSPDPLGLTPSPNSYSYIVNPCTWSDPLGLAPHPPEKIDLTNGRRVQGRFPKKAGPNETLYRQRDNGEYTAYAVYNSDGIPVKRVDLDPDSAPHMTPNGPVPPPHVVEMKFNRNPETGREFPNWDTDNTRPARPDEIP